MFSIDLSEIWRALFGRDGAVDRAQQVRLQQIARDLTEEARNELIRLATDRLHTSAAEYIAAIQVDYSKIGSSVGGPSIMGSITLVGQLANMIERGWAGGDMKPALLAGRNSRSTSYGGRMNVVPFRHMNPRATGRYGQPMGSQFRQALGVPAARGIGSAVYKAAQKLAPAFVDDVGYHAPERLPPGFAPLLKPHHKTDIFSGMIREEAGYGKARQSKYMTFRAVSSRSDPASWIHPGIQPANLFGEVEKYIDDLAEKISRRSTS